MRNSVVDLEPPRNCDERIHEFLSTCIDPDAEVLLDEDCFFGVLWREPGDTIRAARWMRRGHQGSYRFEARP